jgi:cell division protein FtsI (penicillin-binding protein 3)
MNKTRDKHLMRRGLMLLGGALVLYGAIAAQIIRLGLEQHGRTAPLRLAVMETQAVTWSRPDIVDRNGRLLATDIEVHSLYVDPALVFARDELIEKISAHLPDLDADDVRALLADRTKRFQWLRRGLTPKVAQKIHDLGIPGVGFRREMLRAYPAGPLAGHILGGVSIDNRGLGGIEKWIDDQSLSERVTGPQRSRHRPVVLAIETAVQTALELELAAAAKRYEAQGAQGIIIDTATGEVVASASVPTVEPGRIEEMTDPTRPDRVLGGVYELGSVMKAFTLAMAFDGGAVTPDTKLDVRQPIEIGRFTIKDPHPTGRPLTAREVFVLSSNVGSAKLALDLGAKHQRAFLAHMGFLSPLRTEVGPIAPPLAPQHWGEIETATIAYGYGLAVAPLQFAASFATLVNGGTRVHPTYLKLDPTRDMDGAKALALLTPETSARMRALMRLNVTHPQGTGRRAEIAGYRIGGKTGTAEMAGRGGYAKKSNVTTFASAFPMDRPRYVVMVSLFEPKPTLETRGAGTAGANAAPAAGRLIQRVAPLLGVEMRGEGGI